MKRTHLLAPASLIGATLLVFVTLPFEDMFVTGLLHAFAEAGMIGGLADWFAVVALFRHPLGLPIPHTAILPKHRDKLSRGIIDMVQNRWLSKDTILERLASWNISSAVLSALSSEANRESLLRLLRGALMEMVRDVDDDRFSRNILSVLKKQITTDDILRWARAAGEKGIEGGWHGVVFTHAIGQAASWLEKPDIRKVIINHLQRIAEKYADNPFRRVGKWMAESVNALNYEDLAEAIVNTLSEELRRMQTEEQHPARADFAQWLTAALADIDQQEELRAHVERWREELFEGEGTPEMLRRPIARARAWVISDLGDTDSMIMKQVASALARAQERFSENVEAQRRFDDWIKRKIADLLEQYHGEIGSIVERNLAKLSDEQLVRQIEEKVGGDLQYIRVNGAVVGGLVGAGIYLFKYFLM
jgi:uncharacterized membrane-anchored protein YjiN (DUF445 family)